MFTITNTDISSILKDFGIFSGIIDFTELQRYHYEKDHPESKEVRLIIKADLENGQSFVVRFKNEDDVTLDIINEQSQFANLLANQHVETPTTYMTNGQYAQWYSINGYDVIVTVETFAYGELQIVDEEIAEKPAACLLRCTILRRKRIFTFKTMFCLIL